MKKVFVVTAKSESGDDYLAVFGKKPNEKQLSELAHGWDGDVENEGPGDYGSYCYLEVIEEEIR